MGERNVFLALIIGNSVLWVKKITQSAFFRICFHVRLMQFNPDGKPRHCLNGAKMGIKGE